MRSHTRGWGSPRIIVGYCETGWASSSTRSSGRGSRFVRIRRTGYTRRSSISRAECRASQHAMRDGGLARCCPAVYVTGGHGKRARAPSLLRRRSSPPQPPPRTRPPRLRPATATLRRRRRESRSWRSSSSIFSASWTNRSEIENNIHAKKQRKLQQYELAKRPRMSIVRTFRLQAGSTDLFLVVAGSS